MFPMTPKVGVQANFEAVDLSDQAQVEWNVCCHRSTVLRIEFLHRFATLQRTFQRASMQILFFLLGSHAHFFLSLFFPEFAGPVTCFARLAASVTLWEIKRFTVWYWQQALQRWKQERTGDYATWDSLMC